jgi:hypothetical protein
MIFVGGAAHTSTRRLTDELRDPGDLGWNAVFAIGAFSAPLVTYAGPDDDFANACRCGGTAMEPRVVSGTRLNTSDDQFQLLARPVMRSSL